MTKSIQQTLDDVPGWEPYICGSHTNNPSASKCCAWCSHHRVTYCDAGHNFPSAFLNSRCTGRMSDRPCPPCWDFTRRPPR